MPMLLRLKSALLTWPRAGEWAVSLAIYCGATVAMAAVAFVFRLVHWQPRFDVWPLRLSVFIIPAFTEELVFRGLLVPGRNEGQSPVRWIAFGTLAFVLWHVVEATIILPGAGLFLHPAFLFCAGLMGLACAVTRYRTGSLWPAVLFHGFVVFAWQVLLGGPAIQELLR
ncbi:CPBP family glutamic-type intramembrane protease [Asticcacaulis solisilvae]|uniref:CPBP family glutamic-type intramembrane protease n=1 Tax=Asticcacaulis solisilvae TaxID=1217274 RepID=UPI003FD7D276